MLTADWRWLSRIPWGMSRSPYSSVFLSLAPSFPSHSLCLSEVRNLFSARELLHRFCPPVAVFKCALLWGGAQSDAGLFSFLWLKLVSLALFLCLSVSLSPSLCHSGRPVQRQKHNDCVESKQPPPPPHPPVFSSVSQRTEWRGEIYSTAASLMMISFCLNSLPVKGMRTDTRKRQALRISL